MQRLHEIKANAVTLTQQVSKNIARARTVGDIPATDYRVPYRNIHELLTRQTERYGNKNWLTFYSDDHGRVSYSYQEFYDLVCKTANFLLAYGIRRGDRIATIASNHVDTVVQYFAAWTVGAVVVPINVGEDDKRIAYILHNSGSRLAFVRDQFIPRTEQLLAEQPDSVAMIRCGDSPSSDDRYLDYHSEIQRHSSQLRVADQSVLDDEALIVYTSGTTGHPKGVVLIQYNLLIDAQAIADWHQMKPDQRMMCVLPIHHVNGTVVTLVTPMYYGGSVVLNQKFHSHTFFQRIAEERVHVVSVVPTLLQFLLHENPDMSPYHTSEFRHVICGAGPLTCELARTFEERFKIPIVHGYGLSETTCYSCFLPLDLSPDEHRQWMTDQGFPSIGVALPPNEMTIHDDNGNELPEGAKGEIVIRGHTVMKEYHADPQANEKTFAFGWFRSGDEGFYKRDAKGRKFFFITGRIKELIIRGGSNISPFEIDEVLMNMPGIKAGLAVGFENDWYGEEVGAYVQPQPDTQLTELEVLSYCRKFFSFQKSPKVVVFGNQIPVTSTGKYQRNKLRPLFEKWKNTQFTESKSR